MQAGDLKHKIIIQRDAAGGTGDTDWQTLCEVWAAKKGLTGRLYFAAAAAQSENEVIFTIRYREGVKPTMQTILDGNTASPYRITSEPVDVADTHQWLEIHAKRVDQNASY